MSCTSLNLLNFTHSTLYLLIPHPSCPLPALSPLVFSVLLTSVTFYIYKIPHISENFLGYPPYPSVLLQMAKLHSFLYGWVALHSVCVGGGGGCGCDIYFIHLFEHVGCSKWMKYLNVRQETIKLLEENTGRTLSDISLRSILGGSVSLARKTKQKTNLN